MRHVNQTRDGIIQALTPAPLKSFKVRYYVDNQDGEYIAYDSRVVAPDAKKALERAYEIGNDDFGKGNFDCNLVFGS